jgi:hypothetical protein
LIEDLLTGDGLQKARDRQRPHFVGRGLLGTGRVGKSELTARGMVDRVVRRGLIDRRGQWLAEKNSGQQNRNVQQKRSG